MSDILLIRHVSPLGPLWYGLVTNESYPHVVGFGENLSAAKIAITLGVDFVNTLGKTGSLDSLEDFEEVDDE